MPSEAGAIYQLKPSRLNLITDESEIAYLAGFFDGEGCVYIQERNRTGKVSYGFVIQISQSDWPIMEWLLEIGGTVIQHNGSPLTNKDRPHWVWRLGREREVYEFLQLIWPYSKVKSDKILEAMDLLEAREAVRQGVGDGA